MMEETLEYLGLNEDPFDNDPTKLNLFFSAYSHQETYGYFIKSIKKGESDLYALSGEKGTGKTSMLLLLQKQLKEDGHTVVYLKDRYSSYLKFVEAIVEKLTGLQTHGSQALNSLLENLETVKDKNHRTVIIIDNADSYDISLLQHFYIFISETNFQSFDNILVYCGDDGFYKYARIIDKMGMHFSTYNMLAPDETKDYIEYRFKAAGDNSNLADLLLPYFDHIKWLSSACPQKINKICSDIFDIASRKNQKEITPDIMDKIIKDNGHNEGLKWLDWAEDIKLKKQSDISIKFDNYLSVKNIR